MTIFFQNCQFDIKANRVPVQDKHKAHQWTQPGSWLVGRGCFLDLPLNHKMRLAWLVETVNYRSGGRKVRA